MKIAIIGMGLIGGSAALDLRKREFATEIIGVGRSPQNSSLALELGLVDEVVTKEEAIQEAKLILLCVPVNILIDELIYILDRISEKSVVVDMGSTKSKMIEAVKNHPKRGRFVASHPMAGTEYSGPAAAIEGLFDDKIAIICDKEHSDDDALRLVETMYKYLKMNLLYMDASAHDLHAAYVSHISHITSFVLGATVLEKEKSENAMLAMAGGGFASTVRLAKSSPEMWTQIFQQNSDNLVEVLDTYIDKMKFFRDNIKEKNFEELRQFMVEANDIKKILK